MSASFSDWGKALLVCGACLLTSACVTRAEQVASQSDMAWLARTASNAPLADMDPEAFYEDAREMVRTPIDFHGIVLSEEGNPLKGATVRQIVFDRLADPFEFPFLSFSAREPVQTGDDGRFRIRDRGAAMYVIVEVPGWAPVSAPRKLYVYAEGRGRTEPLPSREAPEEFRFERRPPEAELRPIASGALKLVDDGVPLELSLREVEPYGVEPGTGEAIVTCERSLEDAAPDARFDWWCELEIPNGGFQPFTIDMDRAPETGYLERDRLEYSAGDERWDDRADRALVVRFADGTYGFVTISMRMDGDFYVAFSGHWNPTGSTWLD
jgi:hypothetical protein